MWLVKAQLLEQLNASTTGAAPLYTAAAADAATQLTQVLGRALTTGRDDTVLLSGFRGSGKGATLEGVLRRFERRLRAERREAVA